MADNGVTMPERPDSSGSGQQTPPAGAPADGAAPPAGAPGPGGSSNGAPSAPPGVDATAWKEKAQAACQSYALNRPADA